jgi:uncharacterized protein YndB with AHSA1/START domain
MFVTAEIRTMDETRSVDVSVEVTGTPEDVWEAIATGPGLSVWFVPTDIDGDTVTMHHGMLDQTGTITAYDPPHRFAMELGEFSPPGSGAEPRPLALEILVEASSGDTCVVRLVNSGFGGGADWDRQFESSFTGWERCLEILRLYLEHFRGQPHAAAHAVTESALEPPAAFAELRALDGAPAFAGRVDTEGEVSLTMVLDEPAPGIGVLAVGGPGDEVYKTVSLSLFGDDAAAVAASVEPEWQAWLERTSTAAG